MSPDGGQEGRVLLVVDAILVRALLDDGRQGRVVHVTHPREEVVDSLHGSGNRESVWQALPLPLAACSGQKEELHVHVQAPHKVTCFTWFTQSLVT